MADDKTTAAGRIRALLEAPPSVMGGELLFARPGDLLALLKERDRLHAALVKIERISQKPGGVGQIARDTLRVPA